MYQEVVLHISTGFVGLVLHIMLDLIDLYQVDMKQNHLNCMFHRTKKKRKLKQFPYFYLFSAYYQWVPFVLLCMMCLFYIPGFIWRNLNKRSAINTKFMTTIVNDMDQMDGEKREKAIRALAKHIDAALAYHRDYDHGFVYVMNIFFS